MISANDLRRRLVTLKQTHRWKTRVEPADNQIVELNIGKMCINGCFHLFDTYNIPDDFYARLDMDCIINYRLLSSTLYKRYYDTSKCDICK